MIGLGALVLLLLVITVGVERWEKVVIPEHEETFTMVEVESGVYSVSMDENNPCWIGQNWYDCINEHVSSYNHACADRYLDTSSSALCENYSNMIDDMNAQNADMWATVSELGTWGRLSYSPVMETQRVSNNDYRPAKTREAVCILWAFGECRWHDDTAAEDPRDGSNSPSQRTESDA